MRVITAGESHGKGIITIIDGFPAGLKVDIDFINSMLIRRQKGYGRGGRMKIENDYADILSGLRRGITTGAPITIVIWNKDERDVKESYVPRPGHGDLAGALKYLVSDTRFISERASARETAGRVAAGAICELLLQNFQIEFLSFVISIGSVKSKIPEISDYKKAREIILNSDLFMLDKEAEEKAKLLIDEAKRRKDTLGGVFEVRCKGVPPGLGSHTQYDRKLDGKIAGAIMSIQAIKGVEIGLGFKSAEMFGSEVHDPIKIENGLKRTRNNAGGIEAGISNGEEIIVRAAMKPISTLMNPLPSVNLKTLKEEKALVDRSDYCAVPAASVVGEAVVATEIAKAFLEKFGGDSIKEIEENYKNYIKKIKKFEFWNLE